MIEILVNTAYIIPINAFATALIAVGLCSCNDSCSIYHGMIST